MEEANKTYNDILDQLDRKIMKNKGKDLEGLPLQIEIPKLDDFERNPYAE